MKSLGLSRIVLVVIIVAAVFVAAIASYAVITASGNRANGSSTVTTIVSSSASVNTTLIQSLAYAHWKAIGEKNLTLIMSQYSLGYRAVWFFINDSSLGPANGRYDCNIPSGPNNCNYFPESAWQTFFNHTSSLSYTICDYNMTTELDGRIIVRATVWYELENMNLTLKVPYEMDFQYYNSTWAVWKEFFGLQQQYAVVLDGYASPSSC